MFARWLKFNAVGAAGILVQLAALAFFKSALGIHYLWATALAVEAAVLHNFYWHVRWTWAGRPARLSATLSLLVRFNLSNGLLSLVSNVLLMRLLAGTLSLPYLPASLLAIAVTSVANFLLSEFLVFGRTLGNKP